MEYLALILTIIAVLIIAKIFSWPFKVILKLLLNIGLGLILILLVNTFGAGIGIAINFNILTAIIAGLLGIPGVICLIILSFIF